MRETQDWFLGQEDPMEKRMSAHSSIIVWRIPGTEEPGGATVHDLDMTEQLSHTHMCKVDSKRETLVQNQEPYSVLSGDSDGKEIQNRRAVRLLTADSLCCAVELTQHCKPTNKKGSPIIIITEW